MTQEITFDEQGKRTLVVKVPLDESPERLSSTGRSEIMGSSHGWLPIEDGEFALQINVIRKMNGRKWRRRA